MNDALALAGPIGTDVVLAADAPDELRVLVAVARRFSPPTYSANTTEAYVRDIRFWARWCAEHGVALFAATQQHVEAWMVECHEKGLKPSTIARRIAAVHQFYLEGEAQGLVSRVPTLRVRRPAADSDQKLGVEKEPAQRLLAVAASIGLQEEVLVRLLLLNGLRVSEAVGLVVASVVREGGHWCVRFGGKGGKRRREPLSTRTAEAMLRLVELRTSANANPRQPLFVVAPRRTGRPRRSLRMNRFDARLLCRDIGRMAGLPFPFTPHDGRHTFVDLSLEAGVTLHEVQDSAAHVNPRTTDGYRRARVRLDRHATHRLTAFLEGEPVEAEA